MNPTQMTFSTQHDAGRAAAQDDPMVKEHCTTRGRCGASWRSLLPGSPAPDEATPCKFRPLAETHGLPAKSLATARALQAARPQAVGGSIPETALTRDGARGLPREVMDRTFPGASSRCARPKPACGFSHTPTRSSRTPLRLRGRLAHAAGMARAPFRKARSISCARPARATRPRRSASTSRTRCGSRSRSTLQRVCRCGIRSPAARAGRMHPGSPPVHRSSGFMVESFQ